MRAAILIALILLACYLTLVPVIIAERPTIDMNRGGRLGFSSSSVEPASAPVRPNDPGSGGGGGGVHS